MPEYDAENFEPSAPVAYVTLRNPATGALLSLEESVIKEERAKLGK